MKRIHVLTIAAFAALAALGACSGSSESGDGGGDEPSAGESGTGATGGSGQGGAGAGAATGGRGGSAGNGASGGSAGNGGSGIGGAAGTPNGGNAGTTNGGASGSSESGSGGAGAGGSAGGGSGGRECETADDCTLFQDCCNCMGIPEGATPPYCDLVCIQSRCQALQIGPDEVTCSFGRCVIDRSCDRNSAVCSEAPEPCPNGEVRSLVNGCFGPCLPPTECRDVTACSDCGDAVCVVEEPQISTTGCVRPADTCMKGDYCDCLGACPTSGFVCMEEDDAVHCPCPVC